MKITYIASHPTLYVTPLELYELGIGTVGRLVKAKNCYKQYIGNNYAWMYRRDRIALCNPEYPNDWWGYHSEISSASGGLDLLFEVLY